MHSKSGNIEIMINDEAVEVIKELFDSLKNRYQNNFKSMKGSQLVFDYVHLLYYKCYKINPNHGESYIDSPDQIKKKLNTITSKHHGDFYCLNCLHSFATEKQLEPHKKVCENKDFCNVIMPSKDTKMLDFNQYQRSDKAPFII